MINLLIGLILMIVLYFGIVFCTLRILDYFVKKEF